MLAPSSPCGAGAEYCERNDLTIVRGFDDMPPEAEGGEPVATLYLRIPPALKAAVDAKATVRPSRKLVQKRWRDAQAL
jgi:hypothetical protein